MQQTIDDAERDAIFQKLKASPENNKCFDCDKKNPKWASVYLGLYLCLDCAGKHREYGPQISFARSLNLDTWNQRYITFMELGGNAKALEYFKKQGLKAPYDYKSPLIQKYKQELTKKVDAALSTSNPKEEVSKPVFANKVEEEKPQPQIKVHNDLMGNTLSIKSFSDKPRHQEKEPEDPFANNIVINKGETRTKGFTVEFSKNKSGFGTNKGRIAAKKIDNIDLDSLSLNEDGTQQSKKTFDMTDSAFGMSGQLNNVKEVHTKSNSATLKESDDDKFKKFQNAKAISSDAFRNEVKGFDSSNIKKFSGATAISSSQYFGERDEEHEDEIDYYQAAENVKDFFSTVSGKLKEKAEGVMTKIKEDWNS